ncbi:MULTISPECIES: 3'(2'),5'-bisphosphate nucleotidase CysQ [unclassified Lysobacter]|uniref:3'(2'),5'-bisphosphate nucleotidase CysQ n=1 Tax=unclassified Lysobacter TaxID=2635362 RepID=UPI001BE77FFF|nr:MULTISPECIES: 3'(2'),5'-bisphosphate nucleotidase CysQ [unclassified Lysobacter]MBT2745889.1 3'(2'),5'-bisphosphate nucleotidase CysQ [Lysobacter sp. ISL-42]MBT2749552.1 3'(2'),5'-bisphosphate nucleotidase CysQ [Lysobacter sp. ISL-50]MBT2778804.1 3'(2'),5'-bisphosphate nucleotidase CysQ [Lysobacter sp. ISL-54]MBT2781400.1 3'(2'),5'-bisphosphate nucleotidase CysQ [Lysobacter sp. ISL-52]
MSLVAGLSDRELTEGAIDIARAAAAAILVVYDGEFEVERKADASPVTAADMAAHHVIVDGLARLTPDIPVLSEESADEVDLAQRRQWSRLWLVDPLDGTREFVKRNGEFSVNLALIEDGVAVFGLVLAPVGGALWYGQRGGAAFRRDGDLDTQVHALVPPAQPLRVAASRSHHSQRSDDFMVRAHREAAGGIRMVSLGSSLKFCRIAEGSLDLYPRFGPTSEWDTAAGQCVLEAAGGALLDPRGRPFRYNQREHLLNGDFIALGDRALPWKEWRDG